MAQLHDRSNAQEARIADKVNGQRAPRSGGGWARKGDVRTRRFFYEMKRTDNKSSITLKANDLETSRKLAAASDRLMAFGFELRGRNYIVMTEDDWMELTGEG